MRMLKFKRFLLASCLLFLLFFLLVGSSVYFFSVNDFSQWITDQVKQSTGYDVRFENFENRWLEDNRLSFSGVSLYQQDKRVVLINKLDIDIKKLDLWQRQLEISMVHLKGVEVDIKQPLTKNKVVVNSAKNNSSPVVAVGAQSLSWEKLHIDTLKITEFNADVVHQQQHLLLKQAEVEFRDVHIIQQHQLQTIPSSIDVSLQIKSLLFESPEQQVQLDDWQLSLQSNLFQQQGRLTGEIGSVTFNLPSEKSRTSSMNFHNMYFELLLKQQYLRLKEFTLEAFSGHMSMRSEAELAITLFPKPLFKLKQVTVESLQLKDMQLVIPDISGANNRTEVSVDNTEADISLPLENLLLEQLLLTNVNIRSENSELPLRVDRIQLQLNHVPLIRNSDWLRVATLSEQAGSFSLAFALLHWQQSVIEDFSVAGSLTEEDQGLLLLKQLLSEHR
ncbi:hypothetical protein CW745_13470 [Psychromonas sp. psych-6C06]|uniref:AsmA family protein n=1 Tax=Psychromonas sp. psych-6C06 TaxID=2058089 RepID=UPI000C329F53|nr:AsmA family protein [Psychromonas sp. psych-6C06]PKF60878.1 hypothetical protein CW745_13470 [Psychromonas sp. psych-6C06]